MAHYTSLIARPQSFDSSWGLAVILKFLRSFNHILRNEFYHDVLHVFTLRRHIRRVNTCNFNIFFLDSLHFDPYDSIIVKESMVGN